MTETPTEARQTAANLEERRRALADRAAALSARAEQIAYAATVDRDPAARKTLDGIVKEQLAFAIEAKHLEAAAAEAKRRIAQAEAAAAEAELRRKATLARAQLAELADVGRDLNAALQQFSDTFTRFLATGDVLRQLGFAFPGRDLQRVNVSRAIDTALHHLRLSNRPVAPSQQVTLDALVASWAAQVEARIAAALGDETDEAA